MKRFVVALAAVVLCSGCTTLSLRRQTLSHVESAADLRYREVMENLALVYDNPAALPAYCSIYYGTTDVADTIPVTAGLTWARTIPKIGAAFTAFSTASLDFATTRSIKKNWSLDPTVVPEKLYAMHCACWWVLFGPGNQLGDSLTLEKYDKSYPDGMYFDVADRLRTIPAGWLHCGRKSDAASGSCFRAGCRDKSVWVDADGLLALSQFTLVLQQIARTESDSAMFPQPTTETIVLAAANDSLGLGNNDEAKVTVYIDGKGFVTPGQNASSLPRKVRLDNVGTGSDLKSSLSAATKGS